VLIQGCLALSLVGYHLSNTVFILEGVFSVIFSWLPLASDIAHYGVFSICCWLYDLSRINSHLRVCVSCVCYSLGGVFSVFWLYISLESDCAHLKGV
jgi:hypothetical protein